MTRHLEKLNQYLNRSKNVDEYYREYVKRLNKKIQEVLFKAQSDLEHLSKNKGEIKTFGKK